MRTWVYIDGFNFYYGAVKGTPYKWLDLLGVTRAILSRAEIVRIKYFSALIPPGAGGTGKTERQRTYWKALRACPEIEIIEGHFRSDYVRLPTAESVRERNIRAARGDTGPGLEFVDVHKNEEKGSDVNLAVHMVHDANTMRYVDQTLFEQVLVLSNDTDLKEAVRIVTRDIGIHVCLCNPRPFAKPHHTLAEVASSTHQLYRKTLAGHQLPDPVVDTLTGERIHKPCEW